MKVLLINPPIREWSKPNCFPLGLGYVAAVLQENGHEVEVMDINAHRWSPKEVEDRIKKTGYDVAGIGALITVYKYVRWLISILNKHHPGKTVVVGGSVATSIPEIILKKTSANIACIGEGEETVKELFRALDLKKDLSEIRGIWFKDKDGQIHGNPPRHPAKNLDLLPLPAWDLFPMDIYLKNPIGAPNRNKWIDGNPGDDKILSINLSATRGCPYKCIYCYHDFMGQGYRTRSSESVFNEMLRLYEHYNVKYFHFIDDEFVMRKKFVYEFCEKVRASGLGFTWGCAGRVNLMTEDMIATMAKSGCVLIGYGIESGSQKILDILKKGATVEQAKQAIKLTRKYMGWADCSFMIGSPGETRETIQETIDFCKELNLEPEVIFFVTPYPGTELYSLAKEQNKIVDEEKYILDLGEQGEKIRVNFTNFSDEELFHLQEYVIKELNAWNKMKHPEAR